MDKLILRFTEQLKEARAIGLSAKISEPKQAISNIYVAGLGGSGIGANFVQRLTSSECTVPFVIGKNYDIPAFINENTLAIISSFSGNTEETLAAFDKIQAKGAKIVGISSGGKLIETCIIKGYDFIQLPSNWSSPRACLGYSLIQQLFVLHKLNLTSSKFVDNIKQVVENLDAQLEDIQMEAKRIAQMLHNKLPIIYACDQFESTAVRLRQQINENAKALCWHHTIPEMNHNELVGWRKHDALWAVLFLRSSFDFNRNAIRTEINKEIISKYADTIIEVWAKGETIMEHTFYLIHMGDWISYYLSVLYEIDPIEVKVIDFLKSELGKV